MTADDDHDRPQPLLAHLNELRWRIVRAAVAVLLASIIGLIFANPLKGVLEAPFERSCSDCELQVIAVTEPFSLLMKVAFFAGIVIASPIVLYQVWAFVAPALTSRERRWAIPVVGACVLLFLAGCGFGYWTLPRAFDFFLNIFPDLRTDFRAADYFSFVIRYMLAFGISFLYPVFLFLAAATGVVSSHQLARGRRWAVLIIVIVAAAITPTGDALTLSLLSVPLYLFYEVTYWLVRLVLRK